MKQNKQSFFLPLVLGVVCVFSSCVTTQSTDASFMGAWSKREMAQLASHYVEDVDASGLGKQFLYSHGSSPSVTVGYVLCDEDFVEAPLFSQYIVSELRRSETVDCEVYEQKVFDSAESAWMWALDHGIDYLVTGSIRTQLEQNDTARPVRRYYVSLSVVDVTDGKSVYDWKDEHIAKQVRIVSAD